MRTIAFLLLMLLFAQNLWSKEYELLSPDKKVKVIVNVDKQLSYQLFREGEMLIDRSNLSMTIDKRMVLGVNAKVRKAKRRSNDEVIRPIVKRKFDRILDKYNELTLHFRGGYAIEWRAYNEGAAFRWVTNLNRPITIEAEDVNFNFTANQTVWFPEESSVYSHQERTYLKLQLEDITAKRFASTGLVVELGDAGKMFISESDLTDYPGMFLKGNATNKWGLTGKFAGYALKEEKRSDRDVVVTEYAPYLAKTEGKRTFPWRLMNVCPTDADLLTSELVYQLAPACKLDDTSWIKPGKVAWDWWNALNVYGVDFESGVNTATYKYFIDFASEYDLEYIILDEGWYDLNDLLSIKKEVDLKEIIDYGKRKNVGVILWTTWKALEDKTEAAFEKYAAMGAKGFKVDFMQRDDQWMVNYYERIAKKAADYKMLIDYHGSYKPAGLRRAYPNVITREGVSGLEQHKWKGNRANPEYDLILPFTRMVSGPMDYTPGAMINANKKNYKACFTEPMSSGTRCHQLAMYVIYESPLQMLSDNPSNYMKEQECMEFLKPVPTVWDDTKVLKARFGDYIAMARRSGDKWYVGAMTDWSECSLDLAFDFLDEGEYVMEMWQDGVNANKHASDYKKVVKTVNKQSVLKVKMAKGGGWTAMIYKK